MEQAVTSVEEPSESREYDGNRPDVVPTVEHMLFVYFIQCDGPLRPVKIGYARNPESRLSNLQSGCPYRLSLIGYAPVESAPDIEQQLHARFGEVSLRGEWYAEIPSILDLSSG